MPVDAVVDSNEALAAMILRTIRYPGHARALSIIEKIDAEMLEIVLPAEHGLTDIPLAELKLPKGVLVSFRQNTPSMTPRESRAGARVMRSMSPVEFLIDATSVSR